MRVEAFQGKIEAARAARRDPDFCVIARIRADGGIHAVDATLSTVRDIIGLQGDADMRELERRFLR